MAYESLYICLFIEYWSNLWHSLKIKVGRSLGTFLVRTHMLTKSTTVSIIYTNIKFPWKQSNIPNENDHKAHGVNMYEFYWEIHEEELNLWK